MNCGMTCLKYLFFAFNFIFWVLGLAVLGVGIYSRTKSDDWDSLLGEDDDILASVANLMIASGVIVAIIGFLGCCGAIRKNKFMLVCYAVVVLLIFILEIAAGIYAYTKKDKVVDGVEKNLKDSIANSYGGSNPAEKGLTESIDYIQQELECCGATGNGDWKASGNKWNTLYNDTDAFAPKSCCKEEEDKCNHNKDNLFAEGCIDQGEKFMSDNIVKVGGVAVGIAVIQLFGIIIAFCLCRAIGEESD